jgi:hypothetical protein
MRTQSMGIVTAIGMNLLEPILSLVEDLESRKLVTPNEVQASQPENGRSCSVAVLSVFLLESAINRTRYIKSSSLQDSDAGTRQSAPDYFTVISPDPELAKDVEEVFALRDMIAHNHLWEADVKWDAAMKLRFASDPVLIQGYGDRRFRRVLDQRTRRSIRLALNLFPLRVWRRDAYLVLAKVVEALLALEEMDRRFVYISQQTFLFRQKYSRLGEIVRSLRTYEDST